MQDGSVYGLLAERPEPRLFRIVPDKHDQIVNGWVRVFIIFLK